MSERSQTVSVTMLAVTSAIGICTSLLPPLTEVRKATLTDRTVVEDVRMTELAAGALAVAVGVTASSLSGTPVPAVAAVIAVILIGLMYESVLRATPAETK